MPESPFVSRSFGWPAETPSGALKSHLSLEKSWVLDVPIRIENDGMFDEPLILAAESHLSLEGALHLEVAVKDFLRGPNLV